MNVTEAAWYDEQNPAIAQTFPQAICIDGQCSVGATSRGQLLLSEPLTGSTAGSANGGSIPVFSVEKFVEPGETETKYFIGTLSVLGSPNAEDTRKIWIQKDRVDPTQPIGFNILTGNGTQGGTNVFVTAQANLTSTSTGDLQYTITATASQAIPEINITPQVWKKTDAGDVLVYTGTPVACSAGMSCVATGNYTPPDAAIQYFANATIIYTVPVTTANGVAAGTQPLAIVASATVADDPISTVSWQKNITYPFTMAYLYREMIDSVALSQYKVTNEMKRSHDNEYVYSQEINVLSDMVGRSSHTTGGSDTAWNAIRWSKLIVSQKSSNIELVTTSDKHDSGGTPYNAGSDLSGYKKIVSPLFSVAISKYLPTAARSLTINNIYSSLHQGWDEIQDSQYVWTKKWDHCPASSYYCLMGLPDEASHFIYIYSYTDSSPDNLGRKDQPYLGCAYSWFTLIDQVDYYTEDHGDEILSNQQQLARTKIDPDVKNFDDLKYAFSASITIDEWDATMEET